MRAWQLIINGPGYFDTPFALPEGMTQVGRAEENDVVLSGDLVSRRHLRLHVTGDQLVVEDLGSRNGCALNGTALVGSLPLRDGDTLTIGENQLQVRQPTASEAVNTELVDTGFGGQVKRYGQGADVEGAVVQARALVAPSEGRTRRYGSLPPPSPSPGDTDEEDVKPAVAWSSLQLLYRVTEALVRAQSLKDFLDETTDLVMRRVGATTGVVLQRHPTGVLVPAAVRHEQRLARGEVPVSDAIIDAALSRGQAVAVADVRDDARFKARESVVQYGVEQVLCVPIGGDTPFLGALYLNRSSVTEEPVEALLDVCTAVAQLIEAGINRFQASAPGATSARVRLVLERAFAPDVVERRLAELQRPGAALARLEERQGTLLCAEVVELSVPAARLPAGRVLELLNDFQRLSTRLVFSFEGAIVHATGDAVTALFGATAARGDDAIRAVRAGRALEAEWERLVQRRAPSERLLLKVGLTTGKVLVGAVGDEARMDLVVLGDAVGTARALCGSALPGQVLITSKTLAAVGARFDVSPLGERSLAGAARAAVFEVLDEDSDVGTLSGNR
jgi:adenylate cyclase